MSITTLRTLAILLLVFSCSIASAFATTFVALSTDREVVLGIDTKLGQQLNGHIVSSSPSCKLVTRTFAAYAIGGFSGVSGKDDLYPILNSLATDDIDATMRALEAPILSFLRRDVPNIGDADLQTFERGGKPITTIVGVAFAQKGILRDISFYVNRDRTVRSQIQPYQNPASTYTDLDDQMSNALPEDWQKQTDLIGLARKLLKIGIKATPEDSAYPVSIVSISMFGMSQPERPCVCKKADAPPSHRTSTKAK